MSKIFAQPNLPEAEGEVEFYSWSSFRDEVIGLYYNKLDLEPKPLTEQDFINKFPPPLPSHKQDTNCLRVYGRLAKEYYSFFKQYQSQLDGSTYYCLTPTFSTESALAFRRMDKSKGSAVTVRGMNDH